MRQAGVLRRTLAFRLTHSPVVRLRARRELSIIRIRSVLYVIFNVCVLVVKVLCNVGLFLSTLHRFTVSGTLV